jgi:hypothetical protein
MQLITKPTEQKNNQQQKKNKRIALGSHKICDDYRRLPELSAAMGSTHCSVY